MLIAISESPPPPPPGFARIWPSLELETKLMQAALFFYVYVGSYLSEIELRLFMELNQVLVKFTSWRLSFFYNCRGMCGKLFLNVEHDEQLIIKHRIIKTDFMFSDYHAFETTLYYIINNNKDFY